MIPGVAIVGCGLVGQKRARALPGARLVVCADVVAARAEQLARSAGDVMATDDWRAAIRRDDVFIVIVATSNDALAEVTIAAIAAGRHVLVEKPAARSVVEIDPVIEAARTAGVVVRVGFNHRYHPAMLAARGFVERGDLGPLMFVRARYGHGGRLGYEHEWRADRRIAGGGELIDQGVHLIDLARWFLGDFAHISGWAHTYFWNMAVEDNAFLLLRTAGDHAAFLHVSCTEWKNLFSFEVYGRAGKLHAEGLGGSYGMERLAFYQMLPEMGPPETTIWEYPHADRSWELEFADFLDDISQQRCNVPGLADARAALVVIEEVYRQAGYGVSPLAGARGR